MQLFGVGKYGAQQEGIGIPQQTDQYQLNL